jgi:hypothetical protein
MARSGAVEGGPGFCGLRLCKKNTSRKEHPHRDLSTSLRSVEMTKGRFVKARTGGHGKAIRFTMQSSADSVHWILLWATTAIPFVISTEAKRSGEICGCCVLKRNGDFGAASFC